MDENLKSKLPPLTGDSAIDEMINDCINTLRVKGNDYTVGKGELDRLYNFTSAAELIDATPEKVWLIYFYKHWTAIHRYIKEGRVESEPIRGRIMDAICYLFLLNCIVEAKESGKLEKK